jgi:hypothetical protein
MSGLVAITPPVATKTRPGTTLGEEARRPRVTVEDLDVAAAGLRSCDVANAVSIVADGHAAAREARAIGEKTGEAFPVD